MMSMNSSAAPAFVLKPAEAYFANPQTLALLQAARQGDLAQARSLVARGADPDDEGPRDNPANRLRLLHYAIAAQDKQALRVLAEVGADPEKATPGFGPALMFAIMLDHTEMLGLLLDIRPYARLKPQTQETLLFRSVALPRPRSLTVLLQRGAPIDQADSAGYTILLRAMGAQDYEMAAQLLEQGASLRVEAATGATPANTVQSHLLKFKPGTSQHAQVLKLKSQMEARGVVFPVPTPQQLREARPTTK